MTRSLLSAGDMPDGHVIVGSSGYGPVDLLDCATGQVVSLSFDGSREIFAPSFEAYATTMLRQVFKEWKAEL